MKKYRFEIFLILMLCMFLTVLSIEASLKEEPYIKKKPLNWWDTTSTPTWKDENNKNEIFKKYKL